MTRPNQFKSINPATGQTVWEGSAAEAREIDHAVKAARAAFAGWSNTAIERRIAFLNAFAGQLKLHRAKLAEGISREIGKPGWEAGGEVDAMIGKIPVSISAYQERRRVVENAGAVTRFKPHGVVAVFGPFNFPGHLPNGHIVPALLAGNTVVFKPSEMAPLVAQETFDLWRAGGLPDGVLNLVQGGGETGKYLAAHPDLDGLFFTGSAAVGLSLRRAMADHPERILALEMGGNNPLIVHETANLPAAAYQTIQSAFLTAGQRCTCARRLIVPIGSAGDQFVDALIAAMAKIRVGAFTDDPEPFMGPVISDVAGRRLLDAQRDLQRRGGKTLVEMRSLRDRPAMLAPGLMDVTAVENRGDDEWFGPFLQLIRVADFDAALMEANRTAYGLSAGLLSDRRDLYEKFLGAIRAGVVNWNRPITGASGSLPFGGVGKSGNHRPSGYYAADYCSYAVASMETAKLELPQKLTPGIAP